MLNNFGWFLDGEMLEETNTEILKDAQPLQDFVCLRHLNCCLHQLELHCHTASQKRDQHSVREI